MLDGSATHLGEKNNWWMVFNPYKSTSKTGDISINLIELALLSKGLLLIYLVSW
jgi:hypothetical protein